MTDRSMPWSKFFWADWESDESLHQCSLAAQGLWMRMLCICAKSEPRGYLAIGGRPVGIEQLAKSVGEAVDTVEQLVSELEYWNVFSRDKRGRIYSRRMNRDRKKTEKCQKSARIRWAQATEKTKEKPPPYANGMRDPMPQRPEARVQKPDKPPGALRAPPPPTAEPALPDLPMALDRSDIGAMVQAYNAVASDLELPRVQAINAQRRTKAKARLRECGGLDGWRAALDKLRESRFLCGDNERAWRADFDFLLQAKSFTRLMEGAYDTREPRSAPGPPQHGIVSSAKLAMAMGDEAENGQKRDHSGTEQAAGSDQGAAGGRSGLGTSVRRDGGRDEGPDR